MTLLLCRKNLVDVFYHICQVAVRREVDPAWCILDPNFRGTGSHRGSVMVPFERAMVVTYKLFIEISCAIMRPFGRNLPFKCLYCSCQQGVGHFGAKFGEVEVTDVSQILTQSGRDMVLLCTKFCWYLLLTWYLLHPDSLPRLWRYINLLLNYYRLSTTHKLDQTTKLTSDNNRWYCSSAMSHNNIQHVAREAVCWCLLMLHAKYFF